MKRVLSGIQPSGHLHLGNYFGMMARMIRYQEENDLFCFIVNYHALTTIHDKEVLRSNTFNAACDFLALGMDPDKSTFWIQGDVPHVAELTWMLSNVTSIGMMERSTSYKDKIARGIKPNIGLFSYPILMAADILCFGGEIVPVGKDQKQHLEISRDIAQRFNNLFGDVFIVPEAEIDERTMLVPGIDGQKMSKTYRNTIPLFASEEQLKQIIMSIKTDSTSVNKPKNPDTPLFHLYSLFLDRNERDDLRDRFMTPGLKYGDVKKELLIRILEFFKPFRDKQKYLMSHTDDVVDILNIGAIKASAVAEKYLGKAREAMGLHYS